MSPPIPQPGQSGTIAGEIANLLTDQNTVVGTRTGSFSSIFGSMVTDAGEQVHLADNALQSQAAILSQAQAQRESVSGVSLDEEAMLEIVTKPRNAVIKQYQKLFAYEGVELEFTEAALKAIAHKAMKSKTGARGLRSMVEAAMLDIMYVIPEMKGLKKCIISEDTINTNSNPEFIYSDKKNAV